MLLHEGYVLIQRVIRCLLCHCVVDVNMWYDHSYQGDLLEERRDMEARWLCEGRLPGQVLSGGGGRNIDPEQIHLEFLSLLASPNKIQSKFEPRTPSIPGHLGPILRQTTLQKLRPQLLTIPCRIADIGKEQLLIRTDFQFKVLRWIRLTRCNKDLNGISIVEWIIAFLIRCNNVIICAVPSNEEMLIVVA